MERITGTPGLDCGCVRGSGRGVHPARVWPSVGRWRGGCAGKNLQRGAPDHVDAFDWDASTARTIAVGPWNVAARNRQLSGQGPLQDRSPARSAQNARRFFPTACPLQSPLAMSCRSSDLLTYPGALAPSYKAPSTPGTSTTRYSLPHSPQHHPIPHINSNSLQ